MTTYTSQGTVSFSARSTGAGSTDLSINFVPHGDYMVKHNDECYAVFLPEAGDSCIRCIRKLCKNKNGESVDIKINFGDMNSCKPLKKCDLKEIFIRAGAISAATTNSKVEVEVKGTDLILTGITIPAK